MFRVKLNFSTLTIPDKIQKAKSILNAMENNPHFPAPDNFVEQVRVELKALEAAYQDAYYGGKLKKKVMRECEASLDNAIVSLAGHVQSISNGDLLIIMSCGFEVRSSPTPPQPVGQPGSPFVKPGNLPGDVAVSWGRVEGAKIYTVHISEDGGITWRESTFTTKSRAVISGLPSGSRPWFRISARGILGQSHWSDASEGKVA